MAKAKSEMMAEDLTAFFNTSEFAVEATVGTSTVSGIFERAYVEIQTPRGAMAGYRPVFDCAEAGVTGVDAGDSITVNGTTYTVAAPPQPDGTGVTRLILKESGA